MVCSVVRGAPGSWGTNGLWPAGGTIGTRADYAPASGAPPEPILWMIKRILYAVASGATSDLSKRLKPVADDDSDSHHQVFVALKAAIHAGRTWP